MAHEGGEANRGSGGLFRNLLQCFGATGHKVDDTAEAAGQPGKAPASGNEKLDSYLPEMPFAAVDRSMPPIVSGEILQMPPARKLPTKDEASPVK